MRYAKPWAVWMVCTIGCLCTCLLGAEPPAAVQLSAEQKQQLTEAAKFDAQVDELFHKGNTRDALKRAKQALAIRRKVLGDEHPATAQSLNFLGFLYQAEGDSAAARASLEESLKIRMKMLGEEDPETAMSLNNLAIFLFQAEGDSAAARPYFEQALKIRQKVLGDEHPDTVRALNYLGAVHVSTGNFAAARPYWEQALKINRKVLGDEHPQTAAAFQNTGFLLQSLGDLKAAHTNYEQALKIRRKILGEDDAETVTTLNHLGLLLQSQEDYAGARAYCEQALKINKKVLGDDHPDTATALNNLGTVFDSMGDYAAARSYYEQALKIRRKALGGAHPDTVWSLNKLLVLEAAQGHWKVAGSLQDEVRREIRRHVARVLPTLSEKEQLKFLYKNDERSFQSALTVGLLQKDDPQLAGLSAGWLLNGKRMAPAAFAERMLFKRDERNPQFETNIRELLDVRQKLDAPQGDPEKARAEVLKLLATQERLTRQLAEAGGRTTIAGPWVELATVREALPAKSVLIDMARVNVRNFKAKGKEEKWQSARYVAWIIPPNGQGEVRIVDLGSADLIDAAVQAARKSIEDASSNKPLSKEEKLEAEQQVLAHLQKTSELVWKPLSDKLGEARKLFVSPDASLWLLPWSALPIGEKKFLIEEYTVTQIINGRDLVSNTKVKAATRKPVLVTNPDFDLSAEKAQKSIQVVLRNVKVEAVEPARSLSIRDELQKVAPLPEAADEWKSLQAGIERYASAAPQVYTEQFALETILKQVQRPKLVLLGTHGFSLRDQEAKLDESQLSSAVRSAPRTVDGKLVENPLLRCGLFLAGCNTQQAATGDDGILTGMEIAGIELRGTELVVLSACETGSGEIRNGNDVATLRQAFQLAGAKGVLSTLWKIPDSESAPLLSDFFANLAEGQTKTDALRNAQLKRIAAYRETPAADHPFYWATFTLTGQ